MEGFRVPKAGAPKPHHSNNDTFSDMASATASKSGVVGKLLIISLIVVSIAVTAFVGYAIMTRTDEEKSVAAAVDTNSYQAVFLNDGKQVYFGHIDTVDGNWLVLKDVYYLQIQQAIQPKSTSKPKVTLIKLGNELHGPQDSMVISRDTVMFWENLKAKDDSKVVEAIEQYLSQKKD